MNSLYSLNWKKLDPEARLGIGTKKFTGVNGFFAFFCGIWMTLFFYAVLWLVKRTVSVQFIDMFFHGGAENRSAIPYITVLLTMWCLAFLLLKKKKIKIQRKAFQVNILPDDPGFILSADNSGVVLRKIEELVYCPEGFVAFNRIQKTLANLKNIGRVSDVSSVLNDVAIADEKYIEGTYTVVKGLIWAIPVTGFIGTVLGLSEAVGGFGKVITKGVDIEAMKTSLSPLFRATAPTATAPPRQYPRLSHRPERRRKSHTRPPADRTLRPSARPADAFCAVPCGGNSAESRTAR